MINKEFWGKQKVIITGHTGFKGSWLTLWLHKLGARVIGISKDIPTKPSHYELLGISRNIIDRRIDIRDLNTMITLLIRKKYFHFRQ